MVRQTATPNDVRGEMDAVRDDLKRLRSDIASLLKTMFDDTRSGVRDETAKRIEQFQSAVDTARDYGRQTLDTVRHGVEQRPLLTVTAALGVGLLIGSWLRSSRH